jgi:4-aminobutyrate aminotransferase-like enzyme/Ser/Thr protein kinase RdoA (MazF antagonist)
MAKEYANIFINTDQAKKIASELYSLEGQLTSLCGEFDFNFRIDTEAGSYLLKVSRPDTDPKHLLFQNELIVHLLAKGIIDDPSEFFKSNFEKGLTKIVDAHGNKRYVRLLPWAEGRLWSEVNPVSSTLLESLGAEAGKLTHALQDFEHPYARRAFQWDILQAGWTSEHLNLFEEEKKNILAYFLSGFNAQLSGLKKLRKGIIHNDVNDNNIVVTNNFTNPEVAAIIDFGDAIRTALITDLAVVLAYAMMDKPDVLATARSVMEGYHRSFPLLEEELKYLYSLVAMRLVVSVTTSAINKLKEPENEYLLISAKPAWELLAKWKEIDEYFAHALFRKACGFPAHKHTEKFTDWAMENTFPLEDLFPTIGRKHCYSLDLGMQSDFLGHESNFNDLETFDFKIGRLQKKYPDRILAGGYLETRPLYVTDEYRKEGNNGYEYRSVHLGIDFWLPAETPVHALFDGRVIMARNDAGYKEYGGLIVLEHQEAGIPFYTLYGHQSVKSAEKWGVGDFIQKGDLISRLGNHEENGAWGTHLHFQVMLDLLGNTEDFPGVAYPAEADIYQDLCPDPNFLFKDDNLQTYDHAHADALIAFRKTHLGKSLSLSYRKPLHFVRGSGEFLIDSTGRKYLDTVNNVAHVGHEHPRVVEAGKNQMDLLNTNTRYLHENIKLFAEELLRTFPEKLSVVHIVNSGSEANELALRMAKSATGGKDFIAMEVGYHGNSGACIEVSSYKFDGKGGSGKPAHTHVVPLPDSYRGIYRGPNTGPKYANHVADLIQEINGKQEKLAGLICESIISCGGQIELPDIFLSPAYSMIRKAGGVCIADEVQTGCGRIGTHFWGFQEHGVVPDIVTIGKPIGNGHPLAAVVCTPQVAEKFANGMEYFNTFGGNPVSCAIGLEVLRVIKDEELQKNALEVGNYLINGLKDLQKEFSIIGDVRGKGLFLGIELADDQRIPLPEKAAYLTNRMRELGILMSTDGREENVLKIKPPMVFSQKNADELLYRLSSVLKEDFMLH